MDERSREFLVKLKSLLAEYNARIEWGCSEESDTHGIYGEYMYIDFCDRTGGTRRFYQVTVCNGGGIGQEDINTERQE
jgi:hypothetical protein